MIKDYGIDRVIEPKGSIPVTAGKLDNSKKIRPNEVRVSLELIWINWHPSRDTVRPRPQKGS